MGKSFFYYTVLCLFQQVLLLMTSPVETGAGAAVGEQLQQDGVGDTAINDDGLVDAPVSYTHLTLPTKA